MHMHVHTHTQTLAITMLAPHPANVTCRDELSPPLQSMEAETQSWLVEDENKATPRQTTWQGHPFAPPCVVQRRLNFALGP